MCVYIICVYVCVYVDISLHAHTYIFKGIPVEP